MLSASTPLKQSKLIEEALDFFSATRYIEPMLDKNKLSYWASNNVIQISVLLIVALIIVFIVFGFGFLDEPQAIDIIDEQ